MNTTFDNKFCSGKQLFITKKGAAVRDAKVDAEAFFFEWLTDDLTPEELMVLCPLLDRIQLRSRDERRQGFVHLLEAYAKSHDSHKKTDGTM